MIYALLDGSAVIDVPHLRAGEAVWRYCDHSAKIIFGGEKTALSPLALRLLEIVKANAGISRTGLHEATGRNIKSADMASARAELRDAGKAHFVTEATGGRSAERWYA
jgi:hypothetical protein